MQRSSEQIWYAYRVCVGDALIRAVSKTSQKLSIIDAERGPVAIQIYGKDTETMVEAAKIVEQAQPDILDINFGCPVKRVAGKVQEQGCYKISPDAGDYPCRSRCSENTCNSEDSFGMGCIIK